MPWNFDDTRPVYLQIIWEIRQRILTGMYKPGEKLPSVRDLAVEAAKKALENASMDASMTFCIISVISISYFST